jgi:CBS domain-containing protein
LFVRTEPPEAAPVSDSRRAKSLRNKERVMKLRDVVSCMRGDVLGTKLVTAGPTSTLSSVARQMREHHVGAVVIVEGQKPVGIVTDRDLALALGADGVSPEAPAGRVMTTPLRTIPDGAGIFAATQCMRDAGVRRLPIVDEKERLVGMVSLDDLMRLLGRELYNLAEGVRHEVEAR